MVQQVSDIGSNAEENIAHAAKVIGRSEQRKRVFDAIYRGKQRIKKVSEIARIAELPRKRVLEEGKELADNHLVKQTKADGETAYEKINFFHSNKRRILSLVAEPARLAAYPTKRNLKGRTAIIQLKLVGHRAQVEHLTIDEVDSFDRVCAIERSCSELGDSLSESAFKQGLQMILREKGEFKDWGGEIADLFTTRIRVAGRRRSAALALKGPATKGKLTPGKMGKNGDQIQRLFEAPGEVFLVQYCRQIDTAVLGLMQQLAVAKSLMAGIRVYYGIIDGVDSRRLVNAYPRAFSR